MILTSHNDPPRLPLEGRLDLTYRCNNACRHCWLWQPQNSPNGRTELELREITRLVDEARRMGCQGWALSGGEPMLRADFSEIFDYITHKSVYYRLNTNGTLITPHIAQLLTRPGRKMVALYGATAEVHDYVTRSPGAFEATMRGLAYLKEAGARFIVQIVPLRANWHQYDQMQSLAHSLSPDYRVGAAWLWLSADRSNGRNLEIARQRLDPADVISLDPPDPGAETPADDKIAGQDSVCGGALAEDHLFAACVAERRDFHIDPYGQMSFCYYVKDPALRFDLRQGTFAQAWEEFLPSLVNIVRGGQEYRENCGSCGLRRDCRWCAVYGYLEHGRFSARVDYLCQVARVTRSYKEDWKLSHLRYYQIGGLTIQLSTDFPMTERTFAAKFEKFRVPRLGPDTISLRLVSPVPALSDLRLGKQVYRRPPWAIYRQSQSWVYLEISDQPDSAPLSLAIFSDDYSRGTICRPSDFFKNEQLGSLTTFTSDQILLGQIMANRDGCYLHASGMIIGGKGLLFVGHSEAGKSTVLKLLREQGEILCDDRIIVRRHPEGTRIYGTWSHGELPDVSPASAPLHAVMFLEKADVNELVPITDERERLGLVLSHVVRPLVTADWWDKTLVLAEKMVAEVPMYRLRFDKSGRVADVIKTL